MKQNTKLLKDIERELTDKTNSAAIKKILRRAKKQLLHPPADKMEYAKMIMEIVKLLVALALGIHNHP